MDVFGLATGDDGIGDMEGELLGERRGEGRGKRRSSFSSGMGEDLTRRGTTSRGLESERVSSDWRRVSEDVWEEDEDERSDE